MRSAGAQSVAAFQNVGSLCLIYFKVLYFKFFCVWLASHEVRLPVLNKNRFFLLSLLSVPHLCCCFLSLSVFFFLSRLSKALIVCARQQGKCIVNSISLKVGEKEFKEHARLLKRLVTRYRHFSAIALLIVCFLSIMMSSFFLLRILLTVLLL